MLLIGAIPLVASLLSVSPSDTSGNLAATVRRVASTAQLAAQEYRLGLSNGRVVAPQEVAEAALFLKEARRAAGGLGSKTAPLAAARIDSLISLVADTASPDTLDSRVRVFTSELSSTTGVTLDEPPVVTPSLARGADIFRAKCSGCHGDAGHGDGSLAANLDPPPASLADWAALKDQTPLDYFRRIGIGTVATAMPAFEEQLPPADRWAVALYASTFRLPRPAGDVPASLRAFPTTGKLSDDSILAALGLRGRSDPGSLARVAAVRAFASDSGRPVTAGLFDLIRAQAESAFAMARTGDPSAGTRALDAYMTFEQVESTVRAKNPDVAAEVEAAFAALRMSAGSGSATPAELKPIESQLAVSLEKAERVLGDDLSPVNLFVQSFVILLREGLEAILIVGALMTFLSKIGAAHRKRDIHRRRRSGGCRQHPDGVRARDDLRAEPGSAGRCSRARRCWSPRACCST